MDYSPRHSFWDALLFILWSTFCALFFLFFVAPFRLHSQTCRSYKFPNTANFLACDDLPVLDSSIHWNYHLSSNTVDLAFKKHNVKDNQWIAWAINPNSTGMVGSQSFVAFKKSDGTMAAYTSPITSYDTRLEKGDLSFEATTVSASFENGTMIIYAKFQLPGNSTTVNHVWQQGFVFQDTLQLHPTYGHNLESFGNLDFLEASYYRVEDNPKIRLLRKVSGILSGIAWAILMPTGILIGRYLKAFEATKSPWFHLHWICLIVAYLIGTAGCGVGFHMGIGQFLHYDPFGICLFGLFTIQILHASFFRPKEEDQRKMVYWNSFHIVVGYLAMWLAMPSGGYSIPKGAYIAIIVSFGCIATILEFQLYRFRLKKLNCQVHPEIGPQGQGNNQIP
ncbi:hypothetical protein QN277_018729 [Acacia crassicarpa]|uniref:Cytochrome b561 and DOMON domain-containing protein n=1 Tax=Acacia crassicarpa TaxID=499986 RepID=A0AAE1KI46_9FABA|nr:hypothetical protein QN277_018729 [Acacia crassicarpa]